MLLTWIAALCIVPRSAYSTYSIDSHHPPASTVHHVKFSLPSNDNGTRSFRTLERLLKFGNYTIIRTSSSAVNKPPDGGVVFRRYYSDPISVKTKRAATARKERVWPDGVIPYVIASNFSGEHKNLFQRAMRHWENYTCVSFVPKLEHHKHYIMFTIDKCGCCSYVGRRGDGPQAISIGKNCDKFGIVVHELGHVVGFWHEHTRPDRDQYVDIFYKSIQPGFRSEIGQRVQLSEGDIRQAKKLYKCPGSFLLPPVTTCLQEKENAIVVRDGYMSKAPVLDKICGDETEYRTVVSTGSRLYVELHSTLLPLLPIGKYNSICGGPIFADSGSPRYPESYPPNADCFWTVHVSEGYQVAVDIVYFHKSGFELSFVRELDECASGTELCEQHCVNTVGSYRCDCHVGYSLRPDGRTCESHVGEIVTLSLWNSNTQPQERTAHASQNYDRDLGKKVGSRSYNQPFASVESLGEITV
ncbi:putative bacteriochlorophyll 4-vinyl reductase [Teladorsagia circumcincta]|uniref:Metalloendopeptidase n=1 Tax=Teladorsagia circumcincta TaxID=45464 RepID=A0A2G9TYM5_TELCI|nr:putative bacteriochlorophyll 4-vinyl reductase [Teladorsagia circumcincta]